VYVRAGIFEPPPQEIRKPASEIAIAVSSTATARLRRNVNGAPSSTAQNITPLFHGCAGARCAALVVAVIVNVPEPLPPLVSVTGGALPLTNAETELVTPKFTVPA
jgi:hypothetical protein